MPELPSPSDMPAGVAGLGLMGASITACLLAAGHPVVGVETNNSQRATSRRRIARLLSKMREENMLKRPVDEVMECFRSTADVDEFSGTHIVIESISESGSQKKALLGAIEGAVRSTVPIGCNTSAIPISILQQEARHPKRILGIHWAEPAHTTRFLEVICGKATSPAVARKVIALSRRWGKEPTFLPRDICGFITNRCFYALVREALYLVENGYATVARDLFPELANTTEVPQTLDKLARSGAKGVSNARGFYRYNKQQAERWEKLFIEFSYRIRSLAQDYPEDVGDHPKRSRKRT